MANTIQLIVGLGNIGNEYADTRHNAGFWFIDELAARHRATWRLDKKFFGQIAKINGEYGEIWLLKPETYMNRSGQSVQALCQFYKIPVERILVAHDELDIPVGHLRFKQGGGNGGHNGLKDIQAKLGANFYRLRIGIGHPGDKNEVVNYVLKKPSQTERSAIDRAIHTSLTTLPDLINGQTEAVQRILHAYRP